MKTNRLEAFSDGVLAIIITIMVLELKIPEGHTLESLKPIIPTFITYILSFVYLGIYWNNHHHLMHASDTVNGKVLWANLHLLFWLSLFPFATGYMGENHFEYLPTAVYGFVLLMASLAWGILFYVLRQKHSNQTIFRKAYNRVWKAYTSTGLYAIGTVISFFYPVIAISIYVLVAILWFIPNKQLEKTIITN
ncbi:TMEM175 family protein [uncultured Aquimarina sp.]|uniref:TMEM175 family protein n=1 Tax=uncultured Aquimarina sp. TaxID=575652 RepID=UPI0026203511|nr:TMEM175 family protein [uncultured Aquimarina sp.]